MIGMAMKFILTQQEKTMTSHDVWGYNTVNETAWLAYDMIPRNQWAVLNGKIGSRHRR